MTYNKPEVTVLGDAARLNRSSAKAERHHKRWRAATGQ